MIEGEAEVHDRAHGDGVGAGLVRDHDRAFDHRLDVEDRNLGLIDDRGADDRAEAAGVGDREGAALHFVGDQALGAGTLAQVLDQRGHALVHLRQHPRHAQDYRLIDG